MTTTLDGWWFARRDEEGEVRLPHGDGRIVRVGETLSVPGGIVLCRHGLHASAYARDALAYAPGPILCRVQLSGQIVRGDDKAAASERTTLAMVDATRTLRLFAAAVAYSALFVERHFGREPDSRSWAAVDTLCRHVAGAATDAELSAAWSAAESAAWSVHRDMLERMCLAAIGGESL